MKLLIWYVMFFVVAGVLSYIYRLDKTAVLRRKLCRVGIWLYVVVACIAQYFAGALEGFLFLMALFPGSLFAYILWAGSRQNEVKR